MRKKKEHFIQEGQTISFQDAPKEAQEVMKELIKTCPFRKQTIDDWENLDVRFTRRSDGWQFLCKACMGTECSGFILDAPKSRRKHGVNFL